MEYNADIFDAVEFGDLTTLKIYWTDETDIDYQDDKGRSLTMLAARYNHKDIVHHLLTFNPNLSLLNNEQETVFQIAEQLEDKEIYNILVEYCWKEKEKLFLFVYHAKPQFESDFLGAYINCWIMDKDLDNATLTSRKLIAKENWEIDALESISEIKKGDFKEDDDKFHYYEQAVIDKEVLVFYTYDNL